jgi:hypothetical protein
VKKVGLFLLAALLVVALPMGAMAAGTQVYKAKDRDVNYWELCIYQPEMIQAINLPVGPAYEFRDILNPYMEMPCGDDPAKNCVYKIAYFHYVGTEKFNARVKNSDVGWNRNVNGTAYVYDAWAVDTGGGDSTMAAMSAAQKIGSRLPGSIQTMYTTATFACQPMDGFNPDVSNVDPIYSGPFQIEEVLQDDDGDFGCFSPPAAPNNPVTPVNFQDCADYWGQYRSPVQAVDHLMLHLKITGNKIYFWKTTIHEPGVIQFEDHRGYNQTFTY